MWSAEAVVLAWRAAGTGAVVLQTSHTLIRAVCTVRGPVAHQIWVHTLPTSTPEQVGRAFHFTYKTSKCLQFSIIESIRFEFIIEFRHALTARLITLVLAVLHTVTLPRLRNALSFRYTWPLELSTLQRRHLAVLTERRACLLKCASYKSVPYNQSRKEINLCWCTCT